jgi:hypothetical protein
MKAAAVVPVAFVRRNIGSMLATKNNSYTIGRQDAGKS